jgi:hypothetical protein
MIGLSQGVKVSAIFKAIDAGGLGGKSGLCREATVEWQSGTLNFDMSCETARPREPVGHKLTRTNAGKRTEFGTPLVGRRWARRASTLSAAASVAWRHRRVSPPRPRS